MTHEEIAALIDFRAASEKANEQLVERIASLEQQLGWLTRQVFGETSERRFLDSAQQMALGEGIIDPLKPQRESSTTVKSHQRRGKTRGEEIVNESGLRFDTTVPVETIEVINPHLENLPADSYDVIDEKVTHRLAQKPSSYVVLRYVRKVIKLKDTGDFLCPATPPQVLERSQAEVSVLAGMLVDKFGHHMPLHRQHRRMLEAGVTLSRATLTHWTQRAIELLEPIHDALLESILGGDVLTMDETPIKAGHKAKGKMKTGYFWPVYGDCDEVAFVFAPSRARRVIEEILEGYKGVLQTDGYEAYASYVEKVNQIVHAACWAHTRRHFLKAEQVEPELTAAAIRRIGQLYAKESILRERNLQEKEKLLFRTEYCKPIVDEFFQWLKDTLDDRLLLPTSAFTKAAHYALSREGPLRVFLETPNVAVDTNHIEREIRPIALGRRNWLFCSTELGAKHVGIVQSLMATCRLHGVHPYTYLVDVLQRVATHPASKVHLLTPRHWKKNYAENPMRSDLDRVTP